MYVQLLIHVKAIAYSCISNKPNVSCPVAQARETRHVELQNDITPDFDATICQTFLALGWTQEPAFDGYVEEYPW